MVILSILLAVCILGVGSEVLAQTTRQGSNPCTASYSCDTICGDHVCKPGEVYIPSTSNVNNTKLTATTITSMNQVVASLPLTSMVISTNESNNLIQNFSFLGQPIINDNNDIIFPASNSQSNGVFKLSKGTVTKIVYSGDPAPKNVGGVFAAVGLPSSNNNRTIFYGVVRHGLTDEGIFESINSTIIKIVTNGDKIQGGGVFDDLGFPPQAINKKGDIFFYSSIKSSVNGTSSQDDEFTVKKGIFVYSNGIVSKIISKNDKSPLGGSFGDIRYGLHPMNNGGDIVFTSTLLDSNVFQGIFKYSHGEILPIISTLNYTNGIQFSRFEDPSINNKGDIVFFGGNTKVPSSKGIYKISSSGKLSKLLSVGDPTPIGGTFYHLDAISINDNGDVSFLAFMKKGPSVYGIFRISGNHISEISNGEITPTGSHFNNVFMPIMNENGRIVFSANMQSNSHPQGIFSMNATTGNGQSGVP